MKENLFPEPGHEARLILRIVAALGAVIATVMLGGFTLQAATSDSVLHFQLVSIILCFAMFALTFESHFEDFWNFAALAFFFAMVLTWTYIAAEAHSRVPLLAVAILTPMVTAFLPWEWEFQLVIALVSLAAAALVSWDLPPGNLDDPLLWFALVTLSSASVLAVVKFEIHRQREVFYLETLAEDELQFRELIRNSPAGISVVDSAGYVVFTGPSTERLMGYSLDDLLRRNSIEYVHPLDLHAARALYSKCMEHPGATHTSRFRFRHKNGSWRMIDIIARRLPDQASIPLIVLNWYDITDSINQESRIQQLDETIRTIFRYSQDAISILSLQDGGYVDVNDEFLRLTGFSPADVIGKTPRELGLWANPDEYEQLTAEFLSTGSVSYRDTALKTKDGSIACVQYSAAILKTGADKLALQVVHLKDRV